MRMYLYSSVNGRVSNGITNLRTNSHPFKKALLPTLLYTYCIRTYIIYSISVGNTSYTMNCIIIAAILPLFGLEN